MTDTSTLPQQAVAPSGDRPSRMFETPPTRLLYAEDDDDLRGMIAGAFGDAGFDVTSVDSAEAALEQLAVSQFDILVTDYNLGGATAAWLLDNATTSGYLKQTAVIVLTSERAPAGVLGHTVLRKPIDFGVLLTRMGDAIAQLLPVEVVPIGVPVEREAELDLVLYVTSTSHESHKAIRNLHRALKPYDPSRYRLTIVDVANGGDDAWYKGLEDDRIIVTPTLVRRRPGPKTWIVGTLSPIDSLEHLLAAALSPQERE